MYCAEFFLFLKEPPILDIFQPEKKPHTVITASASLQSMAWCSLESVKLLTTDEKGKEILAAWLNKKKDTFIFVLAEYIFFFWRTETNICTQLVLEVQLCARSSTFILSHCPSWGHETPYLQG